MGVAAAIVGGSVIAAGAGIYSANEAASAEKSASQNAINAQEQMFNTSQNDLAPYRTGGQTSETTLNNLLTGTPASQMQTLENIPGYEFTLDQGLQSTQSGAAARGLGTSGAALRGAADYSTGLANSQYQTYANLLQQNANMGEAAAAGTAQAATTTGQGISNSLTGIGNASAAASIASGNAVAGIPTNALSTLYLYNAATKGNTPATPPDPLNYNPFTAPATSTVGSTVGGGVT